MKRLPLLLFIAALLLAGIVLHRWQARAHPAMPGTVMLALRVLDAEGYPRAGVQIIRGHALQEEVVGISDAFGNWRGELAVAQGGVLELRFRKHTAAMLLQAQRTYEVEPALVQDIVSLQATTLAASTRQGHVRLDVSTPYLHRALLDWCQRSGQPVAANGEKVLAVHDNGDGHVQISLSTSAHDLFSFQVVYQQLRSRATLRKILRGIYDHTTRAYRVWYEENEQRWYVYNPAGFWQLRAAAVLHNAQGGKFYLHAAQTLTGRRLALATGEGESVCSQPECVVYSSHAKQYVY